MPNLRPPPDANPPRSRTLRIGLVVVAGLFAGLGATGFRALRGGPGHPEIAGTGWAILVLSLAGLAASIALALSVRRTSPSDRDTAEGWKVWSDERFQNLVEEAAIAIRVSKNGVPLYVNKACAALFGYDSRESLLSVPIRETYQHEKRPDLDELVRRRIEEDRREREFDTVLLRRDGSAFHAHVWTTSDRNEADTTVVAFLVDTTASVVSAEREGLQREQLQHADRMATLGVLLTGMAHEINNPNHLIMLNADLLARIFEDAAPVLDAHFEIDPGFKLSGIPYQEMKPEVNALLTGISAGSVRIRDIVNGLKRFSQRNPLAKKQPVDLNQIVHSALQLTESLLRKSTRRFETDLSVGLPWIEGDPQQLEQVVVNLLTNACQSLPSSDRGIRISTRPCASGEVEVEVEDEGIGIPPENLEKIVEPFFTTRREEGGTGLGLAVSWGIARDHRGRLLHRPRESGGTRAVLRLPARPKEESA